MGRKTVWQQRLEQLDEEIARLQFARKILVETMPAPRRERKPKPAKPNFVVGQDQQAG